MTAPSTFLGPPAESEEGIGPLTLGGLLDDVSESFGEREALCLHDEGSVVRWTYRDLEVEARLVARALLAWGLPKGARVALLMGNRPEWVASAFGVAIAGGVLVPLNTYSERPELEYALRHCDAWALLTQERLSRHRYVDDLVALCPEADDAPPGALRSTAFPFLRLVACLGLEVPRGTALPWADFLGRAPDVGDELLDRCRASVHPSDDALVVYTSGTTDRPKGILHAHRAPALQSWRFARLLGLDPTVRSWSAFPFFWSAGFCMVMGATLAAGGCVVLQERFEPGEALRLLEEERVTTPHAWAHQLAALEDHPDWETRDLSSLRHVEAFTSFGRHKTVDVDDAWSPRAAYGLTETFTIFTSLPAHTPPEEREGHQGPVLPGNALRILDSETGEPLPRGALGEIAVKGSTLMKGYLKVAPEEVFDTDGFFRTGDAGFVDDDGYLHWTGRTTGMIKTGGANVSPVEIEDALTRHPGLKTALAVGVPDELLGEMVVVCAVAHEGVTVDEIDVQEFLRGKLASYKIPRRVLLFSDDDLSLTGNQKVRADELRRLATERLALES